MDNQEKIENKLIKCKECGKEVSKPTPNEELRFKDTFGDKIDLCSTCGLEYVAGAWEME